MPKFPDVAIGQRFRVKGQKENTLKITGVEYPWKKSADFKDLVPAGRVEYVGKDIGLKEGTVVSWYDVSNELEIGENS